MTAITTNLNLISYNTNVDSGSPMYSFINDTSGSNPSQNLGIIDKFAGATSASLIEISASMVAIQSKITRPKSAVIQVVTSDTDVEIASGIFYFRCPSEINGMNISRVQACLNVAGTTGNYTVQVRNMTKYASNDALTVPATIASGAVLGTAGTVNTSYDNVATDDQLKIYVVTEPTTKGKGMQVVLEFAYP